MERLVVMSATQMFKADGGLEGVVATKDLIAKILHYQSLRQMEPFIAINCAAIPETLLESELFGYEKGAFTDVRAQKRGIFELADKGTLFLDEIREIRLVLQAKLLPVIEDQSFRRLGSLKDIQLDLRVVAATNKNLREAVKEGAFRQDLYLTPPSLPLAITRPDGQIAPSTEIPADGISLEDNERLLLTGALEKAGGNQTQTARPLSITRDTLRYKMKKFRLR
jgi:transcriptional regulator with PAS, ATPase and Fis domain